MKIKPLILAGGSGTRLWPMSDTNLPKQFRKIINGKSTFQLTLSRHNSDLFYKPAVITRADYIDVVLQQADEIDINVEIFIEPYAHGTAAASIASASMIHNKYPGTIVAIIPSDSIIIDEAKYKYVMSLALDSSTSGYITLLGINPSYPHTGYGYIKAQQRDENLSYNTVDRFCEKPSIEDAISYISSGTYTWNSGIFIAKTSVLLEEFYKLFSIIQNLDAQTNIQSDALNSIYYTNLPYGSIDKLLIEKTDNLAVVNSDLNWSDIGNWNSLWQALPKDGNNNAVQGHVISDNTHNSYIKSSNNKLIVTIGIEDLIIVNEDDKLLIVAKDHAEKVGIVTSNIISNEFK